MNSILRWLFKGSIVAILLGMATVIWAHLLTQHGGQAWRLLVVRYDQSAFCENGLAGGGHTRAPGFHWLPDLGEGSWKCTVETRHDTR